MFQSWNDTLMILFARKIPHKKIHNEPFNAALKEIYSFGQNLPKSGDGDAFFSNSKGCSPMVKDTTYTLL